jgi:hypothetical protein
LAAYQDLSNEKQSGSRYPGSQELVQQLPPYYNSPHSSQQESSSNPIQSPASPTYVRPQGVTLPKESYGETTYTTNEPKIPYQRPGGDKSTPAGSYKESQPSQSYKEPQPPQSYKPKSTGYQQGAAPISLSYQEDAKKISIRFSN